MILALFLLQGAAEVAPPPQVRFRLVWELREQRVTHELRCEDAKATLQTTRVEGYRPVAGASHAFDGGKLAVELSQLWGELRALPDLAHNSSTFAGVQVALSFEKRGEKSAVSCRAFNYFHPTLDRLYKAARTAAGDAAGESFESLLALSRFRESKAWEYEPGLTPRAKLLEPIDPLSPDADLRRLAMQAAGDEAAYEILPKLRSVFEESRRAGGEGDYFLARAMLRLGEIEGAERVLAVAQSAHPEWAQEASAALEGAFREAFGAAILPPYDFFSPGDPRPAAAERFLAWLRAEGKALVYDREEKRFRKSSGSTSGA